MTIKRLSIGQLLLEGGWHNDNQNYRDVFEKGNSKLLIVLSSLWRQGDLFQQIEDERAEDNRDGIPQEGGVPKRVVKIEREGLDGTIGKEVAEERVRKPWSRCIVRRDETSRIVQGGEDVHAVDCIVVRHLLVEPIAAVNLRGPVVVVVANVDAHPVVQVRTPPEFQSAPP
eukprot:9386599-Pyramimonas_sp.AAC.1